MFNQICLFLIACLPVVFIVEFFLAVIHWIHGGDKYD